jgi:hypothetical protein
MRHLVRCVAVLMALGALSVSGWGQNHVQKMEKHAANQYEREHKARLHRHRTHNRAERAAANHAYVKEHRARLHRHRAVLAAKRRARRRHHE